MILESLSWITDSKARESEFDEQKFPDHELKKERFLSLWNLDYLKLDELTEIKFDTN